MIDWLRRRLGYHVCEFSKWRQIAHGKLTAHEGPGVKRYVGFFRVLERDCEVCGEIQTTTRREFTIPSEYI